VTGSAFGHKNSAPVAPSWNFVLSLPALLILPHHPFLLTEKEMIGGVKEDVKCLVC